MINIIRKCCKWFIKNRQSEETGIKYVYFRPHRGCLDDSMSLLKKFDSFGKLKEYLVNEYNEGLYTGHIREDDLEFIGYGPEDRVGWKNSYLVIVPNKGVLGMCSNSVDEKKQESFLRSINND